MLFFQLFLTFTLCTHVVFVDEVSSRVSCSIYMMARVQIRWRRSRGLTRGRAVLILLYLVCFPVLRPLSRSSERDAMTERLLTNRPSSAPRPSSMLLLLVFAIHIPSILLFMLVFIVREKESVRTVALQAKFLSSRYSLLIEIWFNII